MSFRLLGVPVTIRGLFWLVTVLFGLTGSGNLPLYETLPIWVAVVLVSILVHELGHALAILRHGIQPEIVLHGMGGVALWSSPVRLRRLDRALISLAGPFAGFLLGGLVFAADHGLAHGPLPPLVEFAIWSLLWVNLGWGVINLAPVLPLDGGHVLEEILGPSRARTATAVSLGVAGLLTAGFAALGWTWVAILFAMLAIQSYQLYTLPPGAVLVNPLTAARGSSSGGSRAPSGLRKWWLQWRLKRLEAQADTLHGKAPRRRAGGPELRVIQGGASGPPKDKRYLN